MLPGLAGWLNQKQDAPGKSITLSDLPGVVFTFLLVMLAWVFFRANDLPTAWNYMTGIFSASLFSFPVLPSMGHLFSTACFIGLFILIEWNSRNYSFGLERIVRVKNVVWRWSVYVLIVLMIYFYGNFSESIEFIYFQF